MCLECHQDIVKTLVTTVGQINCYRVNSYSPCRARFLYVYMDDKEALKGVCVYSLTLVSQKNKFISANINSELFLSCKMGNLLE